MTFTSSAIFTMYSLNCKLTHWGSISLPSDLPGESPQYEESWEQQQYASKWWHIFWSAPSAPPWGSHQGQNIWYWCVLVSPGPHQVLLLCTATFHSLKSALVWLGTHLADLKQCNSSTVLLNGNKISCTMPSNMMCSDDTAVALHVLYLAIIQNVNC